MGALQIYIDDDDDDDDDAGKTIHTRWTCGASASW